MPAMDPSKGGGAVVETTSPVDEEGKFTSTIPTPTPNHDAPGPTLSEPETDGNMIEDSEDGWFAYLKTRNFYVVLALGYVICSAEGGLEGFRR